MAYTTQYIGSRYVPLFAEPAEWDSARTYEPLTIVMHEGNSFTSKQFVPAGIDINNDAFWAETGNYNAQVEAYRQEVLRNDAKVDEYIEYFSEKAFAFDTVADMKASELLYNGAICHTNGFHSSGDGGAAWYEISSTGTANEMDVIACGDLFANLVYTDSMSVEMFGSVNGEDAAHILNYATTKCNTLILNKEYIIANEVFRPKSNLKGNGSIIFESGISVEHKIEFTQISNKTVSGLTFDTSKTQEGIYVGYCENIIFENCKFNSGVFSDCDNVYVVRTLDLYTDWKNIKVTNCEFTMIAPNAEGGFWIRNHFGTNGMSENAIIENCVFNHATLDEVIAAWSAHGVRNVKVLNCKFNVRWCSPILFRINTFNSSMENCYFELTQGITSTINPNKHAAYSNTSRITLGSGLYPFEIKNTTFHGNSFNIEPRIVDTSDMQDNRNYTIIFENVSFNIGASANYAEFINCLINSPIFASRCRIINSIINSSNYTLSQGAIELINNIININGATSDSIIVQLFSNTNFVKLIDNEINYDGRLVFAGSDNSDIVVVNNRINCSDNYNGAFVYQSGNNAVCRIFGNLITGTTTIPDGDANNRLIVNNQKTKQR